MDKSRDCARRIDSVHAKHSRTRGFDMARHKEHFQFTIEPFASHAITAVALRFNSLLTAASKLSLRKPTGGGIQTTFLEDILAWLAEEAGSFDA